MFSEQNCFTPPTISSIELSPHVCDACGYYGSGNKQKRVINKIESEVVDDED